MCAVAMLTVITVTSFHLFSSHIMPTKKQNKAHVFILV